MPNTLFITGQKVAAIEREADELANSAVRGVLIDASARGGHDAAGEEREGCLWGLVFDVLSTFSRSQRRKCRVLSL